MSTTWLFVSNSPWASTGYGKQTRLACKALLDQGDKVSVLCNYGLQGAKTVYEGIDLYPAGWYTYSEDVLDHCIELVNPDWVVPLADLWPLHPELWQPHRDLLAPWVPIDHYPPPVRVKSWFAGVQPRQVLAMSRFGKDQIETIPRFTPEKGNVKLVPHCYDDAVMTPGDKAEARKSLSLPQDATVFGMVAMNKGYVKIRKAFPQVLAAFDMYLKKHDPDAVLFLYTDIGYPRVPNMDKVGMNITRLGYSIGIPDKNIYIADQVSVAWGITESKMANLYRAFDVLLLPSMGEGFGVPVIEAQACGTPVIVSDFSAQPELIAGGGGLKVKGVHDWSEHQAAWQYLPDPADICAKMHKMVKDPKRYQRFADNGIADVGQYAHSTFYDRWWGPAFADIPPAVEYDPDVIQPEMFAKGQISHRENTVLN